MTKIQFIQESSNKKPFTGIIQTSKGEISVQQNIAYVEDDIAEVLVTKYDFAWKFVDAPKKALKKAAAAVEDDEEENDLTDAQDDEEDAEEPEADEPEEDETSVDPEAPKKLAAPKKLGKKGKK